MYPAFVNCTTIDWFSEWPLDALLEVADRYVDGMTMANEDEVSTCVMFYMVVHVVVIIPYGSHHTFL